MAIDIARQVWYSEARKMEIKHAGCRETGPAKTAAMKRMADELCGRRIMNTEINRHQIETLHETKFLRCYDLQYAEGKHYYEASRRVKEDLVVQKADHEFREMLPDAVTIAVVLHLPGNETRLLMSYEYRYPIGQFLLSPMAGLLDPEDKKSPDPLADAAVREIREETGLRVKESDRIYVLNPCAFSTPGMTDESNAFLCAEITLDNLNELNQDGAEGTELFDGFELLDRERAQRIFRTGRDDHGNFYSLAAWMVLSIYLSMF